MSRWGLLAVLAGWAGLATVAALSLAPHLNRNQKRYPAPPQRTERRTTDGFLR